MEDTRIVYLTCKSDFAQSVICPQQLDMFISQRLKIPNALRCAGDARGVVAGSQAPAAETFEVPANRLRLLCLAFGGRICDFENTFSHI